MSSDIIEVQNISKYYHRFKALDRVSPTVKEGTILEVIAGKAKAEQEKQTFFVV